MTYTDIFVDNGTENQEQIMRANDTARTAQLNALTTGGSTPTFGDTTINGDLDVTGNITGDITNTDGINTDTQSAIGTAAGGGWDFIQSQIGVGIPSATAADETWIDTDDSSVYKSTGSGTGNWVFQYRNLQADVPTITTDSDLDLTNGELIRNKTISEMQRGKGLWFDNIDDQITIADEPNVNFGEDNFSIVIAGRFRGVGAAQQIVSKRQGTNDGIQLQISSAGYLEFIHDSGAAINIMSDDVITDYELLLACVSITKGGDGTMWIRGVKQSDVETIDTGDVSNSEALFFGRDGSDGVQPMAEELYTVVLFNRALSAAEAKSWSSNPFKQQEYKDIGANQTDQTSGTLTIGKSYRINTYISSDDFTNVGAASNATGVEFISTGTTPTTWTNSSTLHQIGCMGEWGPGGITDNEWFETQNDNHGTIDATVINASKTPLELPQYTTAAKNALTAKNGWMLYDTDLNKAQVYEAGAWVSIV